MTKLSHARSTPESSCPWSFRMTVRRSSESSVAYSFGMSISVPFPSGPMWQNLPRRRPAVAGRAAGPAGREIRDDVELLTRFDERALERQVVARRDDQLMRNPAL